VGVCMCGGFGNMCICIYCVLYFLYCALCIVSFMYIIICFVCTIVRTTATELKLECSKLIIIIIIRIT
jgi:hypothetical protein